MTIEELSARMEKVERANRRMKAAGIAALVLVAAGVAMGQAATPPKVIQAERFEAVDMNGNARGVLESGPGGNAHLALCDGLGKVRFEVSRIADDAPTLVLRDRDENSRAILTLTQPDGDPAMWVYGRGKKLRVGLGAGPRGAYGLTVTDQEGKAGVSLGVDMEGAAQINLSDKDGKVLFRAPQ